MQWPKQLTLIRHAESAYNAHRQQREQEALHQEFVRSFDADWQSAQTLHLARELQQVLADHQSAVTDHGQQQAEQLGRILQQRLELPEILYVSPYARTRQTLEALMQGWSALRQVRVIEEERIREQEFGLRVIYGDWRILQALHPEQRALYQAYGPYWYRYPQGENIADVRERNRSWMNTLTRDYAEQHVLAVTHHITILCIRANVERLSAEEFLAINEQNRPHNCSLTIYRGDPGLGSEGKLVLEAYNQQLV